MIVLIIGGYGSDSIIRSKLVDYAIQRYGSNINRSEIYLIGDTAYNDNISQVGEKADIFLHEMTFTDEDAEIAKLDIAFQALIGYVSTNLQPADYKLLNNVKNVLDAVKVNGHISGWILSMMY